MLCIMNWLLQLHQLQEYCRFYFLFIPSLLQWRNVIELQRYLPLLPLRSVLSVFIDSFRWSTTTFSVQKNHIARNFISYVIGYPSLARCGPSLFFWLLAFSSGFVPPPYVLYDGRGSCVSSDNYIGLVFVLEFSFLVWNISWPFVQLAWHWPCLLFGFTLHKTLA